MPFNYKYTCPHCEEKIDALANWECGWCGNENKLRTLGSPLALEACGHRACRHKKQCAIRCPHCGLDTILDVDVYEQTNGALGVAKLLV